MTFLLKKDMHLLVFKCSQNSQFADSVIDSKDITREGIALLQNGVDQKPPAAHFYMGRSFLEGNGISIDKEFL